MIFEIQIHQLFTGWLLSDGAVGGWCLGSDPPAVHEVAPFGWGGRWVVLGFRSTSCSRGGSFRIRRSVRREVSVGCGRDEMTLLGSRYGAPVTSVLSSTGRPDGWHPGRDRAGCGETPRSRGITGVTFGPEVCAER